MTMSHIDQELLEIRQALRGLGTPTLFLCLLVAQEALEWGRDPISCGRPLKMIENNLRLTRVDNLAGKEDCLVGFHRHL